MKYRADRNYGDVHNHKQSRQQQSEQEAVKPVRRNEKELYTEHCAIQAYKKHGGVREKRQCKQRLFYFWIHKYSPFLLYNIFWEKSTTISNPQKIFPPFP